MRQSINGPTYFGVCAVNAYSVHIFICTKNIKTVPQYRQYFSNVTEDVDYRNLWTTLYDKNCLLKHK